MIRINDNLCTACGKCVDICPEGFSLEAGRVRVKNPDASCVKEAMEACSQKAIQSGIDNPAYPMDPNQPPPGSGMGRGMGSGRGAGMGRGRGMGSGRGSGMGRGTGSGRGRGGGGRGR